MVPARAGMSPPLKKSVNALMSGPRASGDEPASNTVVVEPP